MRGESVRVRNDEDNKTQRLAGISISRLFNGREGGAGKERDKYSLTLAQVIYTVTCATRVFICTLSRRILQCTRGIHKRDKYIFFPRHPPLSFWLTILSLYTDLKDPSTCTRIFFFLENKMKATATSLHYL